MSVRVLESVYQKAPLILYKVNSFEGRDNFLSRRNKNYLLVGFLVDSDLRRCCSNC